MADETDPNTSTSDDAGIGKQDHPTATTAVLKITIVVAALWAIGMAFYQGVFINTFWKFLLAMFVVGFVVSTINQARQQPWLTIATHLAMLIYVWLYLSGAWRSWSGLATEVFVIVFVFGLVGSTVEGLGEKYIIPDQPSELQKRRLNAVSIIVGLIAGWCAISGFTVWRSDSLLKEPLRFTEITPAKSIVPSDEITWHEKRIGIALSGGGYRAALFHAGVLNALETLGIRVQAISAVSGGSIIGVYYAFGGDPLRFKQAMLDRHFNLVREVMLIHRAVPLLAPMRIPGTELKLLPWWNYDRGNVQASMVRRLLGIDGEWQSPSDHQPELLIAATDLTYGMLIGFIHDGILIQSPEGKAGVYRNEAVSLDRDFDLADLVAASGAFPVAFPAVALGVQTTTKDTTGKGIRPLELVDGGVGDNTGLKLLQAAHTNACKSDECAPDAGRMTTKFGPGWALDAILVSDASAIFGVEEESSGVGAALRAFDVAAASTALTGELTPLRISPSDSYMSRRTQFQKFDGEDQSVDINEWQLCFEVDKIPEPVLAALVGLLPTGKQASAREALAKHSRAIGTNSIEQHDDRCTRLPQTAIKLHDLIVDDIRLALNEFRDTSTLEDQMSAERVDKLFRLGQYLTYVNWPLISRELSK